MERFVHRVCLLSSAALIVAVWVFTMAVFLALYGWRVRWAEIPRDHAEFLKFAGGLISTLEDEIPTDASSDCLWCRYQRLAY